MAKNREKKYLNRLKRMRCWHVNHWAPCCDSTITLQLGKPVRLENSHNVESDKLFHTHDGQYCLFLDCRYVITLPDGSTHSSDHVNDVEVLWDRFIGSRIVQARIINKVDLWFRFDNGLTIHTLMDERMDGPDDHCTVFFWRNLMTTQAGTLRLSIRPAKTRRSRLFKEARRHRSTARLRAR